MKSILTVGILVLGVFASDVASAIWLPGKMVNRISMGSDSGKVFVEFDQALDFPGCPNARTVSFEAPFFQPNGNFVPGSARFDEIYAAILVAKAQGMLVQIRDDRGSCASPNVVGQPQLRFL